MPIYKDKNGTWFVMTRYTDWTGAKKQKCKRGFVTRREAQKWESEFTYQSAADLDMEFNAFLELYTADMKPRLKENTWLSKEHVINTKILPYFGKKKISEISPGDIRHWQTELLSYRDKRGRPYSKSYLSTVHSQLSSIFNHAVKYYGLKKNPARIAGGVGEKESKEMLFWTKEEYLKFAEAIMNKPLSYYAFEILYWCGIREGELLALTPKDFDLEKKTLRINKSYQRLNGKDVITSPKTRKSIRTIKLPDFLIEEIRDFLEMQYELAEDDRLFPVTKYYLHHEMERGTAAAGVKRIRIHDLRHSHVSLMIEMGFSALAIAERLGHESIKITYRYAHLFPSKQDEMADMLNKERSAEDDSSKSR